jgi:hypothetical protein
VIAEGSYILPALDVAGEVGKLNSLDKTFFMPVTDGTMNVRFVVRQGSKEPIINAIRVAERPDRH